MNEHRLFISLRNKEYEPIIFFVSKLVTVMDRFVFLEAAAIKKIFKEK